MSYIYWGGRGILRPFLGCRDLFIVAIPQVDQAFSNPVCTISTSLERIFESLPCGNLSLCSDPHDCLSGYKTTSQPWVMCSVSTKVQ